MYGQDTNTKKLLNIFDQKNLKMSKTSAGFQNLIYYCMTEVLHCWEENNIRKFFTHLSRLPTSLLHLNFFLCLEIIWLYMLNSLIVGDKILQWDSNHELLDQHPNACNNLFNFWSVRILWMILFKHFLLNSAWKVIEILKFLRSGQKFLRSKLEGTLVEVFKDLVRIRNASKWNIGTMHFYPKVCLERNRKRNTNSKSISGCNSSQKLNLILNFEGSILSPPPPQNNV